MVQYTTPLMQAMVVEGIDTSARLKLKPYPCPEPSSNEVLIHVKAAGVNRADLFQVKGLYPPEQGLPNIPGLEVSGDVIKVGKDVVHTKVGDAVCALLPGCGYATHAVTHASLVMQIPKNCSYVEAASFPEAYCTAFSAFNLTKLNAGETVLIHGASGGVGMSAIQYAKALGAQVIGTVGSEEKKALIAALGTDHTVILNQATFLDDIYAYTSHRGVDVIIDILGAAYLQQHLKLLKKEGRLLILALLEGKHVEVNLAPILMKHLSVIGSTLRSRTLQEKADIVKQIITHIWPLIESKQIKPVVSQTFPLEKANEAHQRMQTRQHTGKLILTVDPL